MKTAWQGHSEQDLVEVNAKGKALHNAGQGHLVQFLVEVSTKGQALQTAWQSRSVQALVKSIAKVKLCRLLGKVALSTLWFKSQHKVKL